MTADYLTTHQGHTHPLQEGIHRGWLTCYARVLPSAPDTPELRSLREIGRDAIAAELQSCLAEWLSGHLRVVLTLREDQADVVLGYSLLAGPGQYYAAMQTGWKAKEGGTSHIRMDYQSMRWHRTQSRLGVWASTFGKWLNESKWGWRIPVRSLLLHECGHALGLAHTDRAGSIMEGPGTELVPRNPLHTVSDLRLPDADKAAFADYFARVKGGMGA